MNKQITEIWINNLLKQYNISYVIQDINLFLDAFTHKSYCISDSDSIQYENLKRENSYERLEFLGDSILDSVIAEYLFKRFSNDEGFLTKIKIRLVNGEQLAKLSLELGFNDFILISKSVEDKYACRTNTSLLEDVFESFIGALYLDCDDYKVVQKFIINVYEDKIDFPELILNDTNYKEQISKYLQHNHNSYPTYTHNEKDKDMFSCQLIFDKNIISTGFGKTKKKAEQNAAYRSLIYYNVLSE